MMAEWTLRQANIALRLGQGAVAVKGVHNLRLDDLDRFWALRLGCDKMDLRWLKRPKYYRDL